MSTMDNEKMLTTKDNPYNPKTDYPKWKAWDEENGYDTEAFIARLLVMEPGFDFDDEFKMEELTKKVIVDVIEHDMTQMYVLV